MKIPARLLAVLTQNQALDGAIKLSISHFEPWIQGSNLPFFPEYTDHGIDHLEQVLATASSLIRDEAWAVVTPEDAAVLILSVLLHDCAMHLSESAFVALLSAPWRDRSFPHMGDPSWSVLWEEFLGEASRFDGRKLKSLFGNSEPARRPPLDPLKMEMRDRLLIGEFLRRHHPRLAQEIAAFGVPGSIPAPLTLLGFNEIKSQRIVELAGIVARSHGTPIRTLLPVIEKRFDEAAQRECCGVHPAFLMAVLRIADYIQVQAERAPEQLLRVKRLHSPLSQREWKTHHAVEDIRQVVIDPEAIYIVARPKDVETFIRIQEWISGIQHELDASWAVLGEVYGRFKELASLGIVIRRIRSNLEDVRKLESEIDYLPVRASFRAADADLLKLLIGPLYGDEPAIGMRELMQNAIDAVRELTQLLADRNQTTADVELTKQDADVVCTIEKDAGGQHWATVSDKGIGMTVDVIINYLLNAGASFRRSDDWKKSFETTDGNAKVLRAGRFGVGALAAFLLGNEIRVTTRHIDSQAGLAFVATVDTEAIAFKKVDRPIGTTISIPIAEQVADGLSQSGGPYDTKRDAWDWYVLTNPSVKRIAYGQELKPRYQFDGTNDCMPGWLRVPSTEYAGVFWKYGAGPMLACNGIVISKNAWTGTSVHFDGLGFYAPNLIINDQNGKLPVNLSRSQLTTERLSFFDDLDVELTRYLCAFGLSQIPASLQSIRAVIKRFKKRRFEHVRGFAQGFSTPWFFTSKVVGLQHPWLLRQAAIKTVVAIRFPTTKPEGLFFSEAVPENSAFAFTPCDMDRDGFECWVRDSVERHEAESDSYYKKNCADLLYPNKGVRILLPAVAKEEIDKRETITPKIWNRAKVDWEENGWVMLTVGNTSRTRFPFREFAAERCPPNRCSSIVEAVLDTKSPLPEPPLLVKRWMEILGQPLIPIDLVERKTQLASAFESLAPYIEAVTEEMRQKES